MPIRSKAQRRWIWQQVREGKWSKEEAEQWEKHTPHDKDLPERIHRRMRRRRHNDM